MEVNVVPLYEKEVSFLHYDLNDNRNKWVHKPTKKVAVFREFSRVDKAQHKLSMFIAKCCRKFPRVPQLDETGVQKVNEKGVNLFTVEFDDETIYDIAVRYIQDMGVDTPDFGATERAEMLNDSGAIYQFGWWLIGEKVLPFFLVLNES